MSRWQPNTRGRLVQAAIELYGERGFEQTTVAAIAERAGLTERTFFRYFADKREVLFSGTGPLQESLVAAIAAGPPAPPMAAVIAALQQAGDTVLEQRRAHAQRRRAIIAANAELHERELIKLATLASALAGALRERGVPSRAAGLAAEAGIVVFKIAYDRWVAGTDDATLSQVIHQTAAELSVVVAGSEILHRS